MLIQFFGAARTVTGSKHLITTEKGTKILLDCGLFQGIQTDEFNQEFGFKPSEVDYVVLSHAHIDHSGLLPRLVRKGFKGPIYCTAATADLCRVMLLDSAHIQEKDLERINKRRQKQGRPLLEELYNAEDAAHALNLIQNSTLWADVLFGREQRSIGNPHRRRAFARQRRRSFKHSGRWYIQTSNFYGRHRPSRGPHSAQAGGISTSRYIICESTYGDRLHEKEIDMHAHLLSVVQETCVRRRGKLIIPAFAIDRTQELIYALDQLSSSGQLPQIPVYIDSPLAIRATAIMKEHDECFNPEILEYIEKDGDAFAFPYLNYISDVQQSMALNDRKEPCIIISASGMAEAGRIKHHIKNNIGDPNSTILLVGYASANTLAGALKRGDSM
jgi:metallo-beta-lactamase family protein